MNVKRSILHADDDPVLSALVAAHLQERGYDVTSVDDPREVIPCLLRNQQRVALLDIDMPHIDGLRLLRQIKEFDGGIQVVMLTGLVSMTTVLQSLRWGAEACFFKPLSDFGPLADALADCFRKSERWWTTLDELSRRRRSEGASFLPEVIHV
jgi:CheY-like chemotaxis protein